MYIAIIVVLILIIIFVVYKNIQHKMELFELYTAEGLNSDVNTSEIIQEKMASIFYPTVYLN
jgi:hypothetical protein